jgi:L-ascorbate metabolism protein UlaG (beta-lactamase superfamily)
MRMSLGALKHYAGKHLRWYGQSAFRIVADSGETIAVDPFRMPASAGPVDMILVTHPHFDHFDRRAVAGLRTRATTVVVPQSSVRSDFEGMRPGQTIKIGDLAVSAVPAYTPSRPFHPRARGWVGYIIELDGLRIYHAGDTDIIPVMKGLAPDIALLPVGGVFSMNVRMAVEAAASLQAALAIPMHFNWFLGGGDAGARFTEAVGEKGLILPLA